MLSYKAASIKFYRSARCFIHHITDVLLSTVSHKCATLTEHSKSVLKVHREVNTYGMQVLRTEIIVEKRLRDENRSIFIDKRMKWVYKR